MASMYRTFSQMSVSPPIFFRGPRDWHPYLESIAHFSTFPNKTMDSGAGKPMVEKPAFARIDSHQVDIEDHNFGLVLGPTAVFTPNETELGALRLLDLPREIRDHIYSYLHQPHQLIWEIGKRHVHCVSINVPKAPIPAVLQTCTRLRDEYRESPSLRTLAATISTTRATNHETAASTDLQCHAVARSVIMHTEPAPIEHVAYLLASVRTVTILMENKRSLDEDTPVWNELRTLESLLSPFHQTLTTIRVAVHQCQDPHPLQMNSRRETEAYTDPSLITSRFMPIPSTTFMGKPLIQQAAGYRLQLVLLQMHPSDQEDLLERFHRHRTGVYVYSDESPIRLAKEGLYWIQGEVVKSFPINCSWFNMQRSMNLNMRDRFDAFGVTDAWIQTEYGSNACKMMEWREKRGKDATEWEV
ncbi:uncharacterized protein M421DRAFT_421727 [Didymella exigua CBS 183.55]|uniref:Uncharacterized protein n=1 Tax=Didymella exigua CBS 183.55 TaxID=1150837 RepID=A0A6A5RLU0_9PLEO|nr:uncharacterized protein M421DRAFT_421727 [Didymella exigua CBS 183.55]KAF1927326.1 hypothetical protein M421DRAFT_421727 [Didymella exigua CBS 183.55]